MNCRERAEECLWKVSRSLDQRSRSQLHLKFSPQITEQMKFSVYLLVFQFYIRHRFQWSYKVCFVSLFIFNFFSSIWYHTHIGWPRCCLSNNLSSSYYYYLLFFFFFFSAEFVLSLAQKRLNRSPSNFQVLCNIKISKGVFIGFFKFPLLHELSPLFFIFFAHFVTSTPP